MTPEKAEKRKLMVGVAAIIVMVAAVAVFAVLFVREYQILGDTIEQDRIPYVTEIKEQLVGNIEMEKEAQLSAVSMYCHSILSMQPESFAEVAAVLDGSQLETGDKIFLMDEDGTLYDLYGNRTLISNQEIAQRLLLNRENVFSYAQVNQSDEYWFCGMPIDGVNLDDVSIQAVLSARSIHNFGAKMAAGLLDNTGFSLVTSRSGNVILFPATDTKMGYNLFQSLRGFGAPDEELDGMRTDFAKGADGQAILSYDGDRWLIAYSGNVFDDWMVAVLVPMTVSAADTYQALSDTMRMISLLMVSILILLIVSITFFFRRERARERALQQERLELEIKQRTADTKNEFLAKMSHDIRTPLNAVMGLLQITQGQVKGQPKVEQNLNQAEQAAEYLLSVLNDILDMSKIESGKMQINSVPFSLKQLLETIETINHTQAKEKGLDFRVEVTGDYAAYYTGDPLRMKQILMNLLSNAIKFTKQGGSVLLKLSVSPGEETDLLSFCVEDTGDGMSEEYLENIFQPFEQESANVALTHAGTGLGLSIVKNLVDLMGGEITVTSEKGRGSCFNLFFSLARASAPESKEELQADEEGDISLEGCRLLLAEDNELNAMIAMELISIGCGMEADWAENGKVAAEKFTASAPDEYVAILMDIRMPVMDGLSAATAIRASAHPRASAIPIIALSANAFDDDAAMSLKCGMNAHLAKPIDIDKLGETLKLWIKKERTACATNES